MTTPTRGRAQQRFPADEAEERDVLPLHSRTPTPDAKRAPSQREIPSSQGRVAGHSPYGMFSGAGITPRAKSYSTRSRQPASSVFRDSSSDSDPVVSYTTPTRTRTRSVFMDDASADDNDETAGTDTDKVKTYGNVLNKQQAIQSQLADSKKDLAKAETKAQKVTNKIMSLQNQLNAENERIDALKRKVEEQEKEVVALGSELEELKRGMTFEDGLAVAARLRK